MVLGMEARAQGSLPGRDEGERPACSLDHVHHEAGLPPLPTPEKSHSASYTGGWQDLSGLLRQSKILLYQFVFHSNFSIKVTKIIIADVR